MSATSSSKPTTCSDVLTPKELTALKELKMRGPYGSMVRKEGFIASLPRGCGVANLVAKGYVDLIAGMTERDDQIRLTQKGIKLLRNG